MKIDRLYTLSQFADSVENDVSLNWEDKAVLIFTYNDFLKQPLKKEMFVNEMDKSFYDNGHNAFDREYREAEKKVIFEGVEIVFDSFLIEPYISIPFYNGIDKCIVYETLSNIAESTSGQLKLKNVDL